MFRLNFVSLISVARSTALFGSVSLPFSYTLSLVSPSASFTKHEAFQQVEDLVELVNERSSCMLCRVTADPGVASRTHTRTYARRAATRYQHTLDLGLLRFVTTTNLPVDSDPRRKRHGKNTAHSNNTG